MKQGQMDGGREGCREGGTVVRRAGGMRKASMQGRIKGSKERQKAERGEGLMNGQKEGEREERRNERRRDLNSPNLLLAFSTFLTLSLLFELCVVPQLEIKITLIIHVI